jgi:hypothetical protein
MIEATWNAHDSNVLHAHGATLTIHEGNGDRTIRLTPSELRTGKVSWRVMPDDIFARMTLELPDGAVLTQSVSIRPRQ